jgi:hypothetical protein
MAVAAKKKTAKKKTTKPAKRATKKIIKKGDRYACTVCGIAVRVDEACGCLDMCDIICCGRQMKPKRK